MQEFFTANNPMSIGLFYFMVLVAPAITALMLLGKVNNTNKDEPKKILDKFPLGSKVRKARFLKYWSIFVLVWVIIVFFLFSTMYGIGFLDFTLYKLGLLEYFVNNFGYKITEYQAQ
jgi:hypothetical protein